MPDNPSLVLRAIKEIVYEERPIPERALFSSDHHLCKLKIG